MTRYVSSRRPVLHALTALCAALAASFVAFSAQASSHREAPSIALMPKVDNTDVYAFMSYEQSRLTSGYVTLISNFQPLQAPYGGPNYFKMDPNALYEIHVDNNGDAKEDITFQFKFQNDFKAFPLTIGTGANARSVPIPLTQFGQVSNPNDASLNVNEKYTATMIRGDRRTGVAQPITLSSNGTTLFDKPADNIGDKTIPNYAAYANRHIYDVTIPGCAMPARMFVGQRKEGFAVNLGRVFDLVNAPAEIITDRRFIGAEPNPIDDTNVTTIALEVHKSCLATADDSVIGIWSSASIRQSQLANATPPRGHQTSTSYGGGWVQVSRLGNPLVNEVVIGLPDKDRFNASVPGGDIQFLDYVTNPTLPELLSIALKLPGIAPTNIPRTDLVTAFLTGIATVNQPKNVKPSEMLRLNTAIAPVPFMQQNRLGIVGSIRDGGNDFAGFPNGRRPKDDVVDIALVAVMGGLCIANGNGNAFGFGVDCKPSAVPLGTTSLELHDAVDQAASPFLPGFPYLFTPTPGATALGGGQSQSAAAKARPATR